MKLIMVFTLMVLPFATQAKDIDYSYCQDAIENLFQLEKIPGQKLPAVFEINEQGNLVSNEDYIQLHKYDEQTGEYTFRTKSRKKKSFSLFSKDEPNEMKMYSYTIKKDQKGRLHSITSQGNCEGCKETVEITYSKHRCVPKRVYATNMDNITTLTADAETCKSLNELQKDLYKKMRKANKCLDKLNEFYRKTSEVTDVLRSKTAEAPQWSDNLEEGLFSQQLEAIYAKTSELIEADTDLEARLKDENVLQKNLNSLLGQCHNTFSDDLVDTGRVYKDKNDVYEIKKEDQGIKVENPLDNIGQGKPE